MIGDAVVITNSTGALMITPPVTRGTQAFDEWVQPCRHWDHPETKRRMHNLICASGLIDKLKPVPPREATEAELC